MIIVKGVARPIEEYELIYDTYSQYGIRYICDIISNKFQNNNTLEFIKYYNDVQSIIKINGRGIFYETKDSIFIFFEKPLDNPLIWNNMYKTNNIIHNITNLDNNTSFIFKCINIGTFGITQIFTVFDIRENISNNVKNHIINKNINVITGFKRHIKDYELLFVKGYSTGCRGLNLVLNNFNSNLSINHIVNYHDFVSIIQIDGWGTLYETKQFIYMFYEKNEIDNTQWNFLYNKNKIITKLAICNSNLSFGIKCIQFGIYNKNISIFLAYNIFQVKSNDECILL
jgi:hypothetical protein